MAEKRKRYRHTRTMQRGGDDGYQYVVDVRGPDGNWRERINGLTRREVAYYRDRFEAEAESAKSQKTP